MSAPQTVLNNSLPVTSHTPHSNIWHPRRELLGVAGDGASAYGFTLSSVAGGAASPTFNDLCILILLLSIWLFITRDCIQIAVIKKQRLTFSKYCDFLCSRFDNFIFQVTYSIAPFLFYISFILAFILSDTRVQLILPIVAWLYFIVVYGLVYQVRPSVIPRVVRRLILPFLGVVLLDLGSKLVHQIYKLVRFISFLVFGISKLAKRIFIVRNLTPPVLLFLIVFIRVNPPNLDLSDFSLSFSDFTPSFDFEYDIYDIMSVDMMNRDGDGMIIIPANQPLTRTLRQLIEQGKARVARDDVETSGNDSGADNNNTNNTAGLQANENENENTENNQEQQQQQQQQEPEQEKEPEPEKEPDPEVEQPEPESQDKSVSDQDKQQEQKSNSKEEDDATPTRGTQNSEQPPESRNKNDKNTSKTTPEIADSQHTWCCTTVRVENKDPYS